jgi:hypothetical protein
MKHEDKFNELVLSTMAGIATLALFLLIHGLLILVPLWLCWNYVMPDVFGLPVIGPVQAFCMSIVASVLVKPVSRGKDK